MKNKLKAASYSHLPKVSEVEDTVLMQTLYRALSVKRPSGSHEEASFAAFMAVTYGATLIDEAGNIHFDNRKGTSRSMFTSHTDTVHRLEGHNDLRVDGRYWRCADDVLGADDGAGCALIAHMLTNDVPGYYVLFRGEEIGGVGSKWLYENMPHLLEQFDRAIAFDRAGSYDVITHQGGQRCCSDEFASALADQLSQEDSGLMFMPSDAGVYTDTAEFTSIVPECTNCAIGYARQHSQEETQDIPFLKALASNLVFVDWESLPTKRDPAEVENLWAGWAKYGISESYFKTEEDIEEVFAMTGKELELFELVNAAIVDDNFKALHDHLKKVVGYFFKCPKVSNETYLVLEKALDDLVQGSSASSVASDLAENWK